MFSIIDCINLQFQETFLVFVEMHNVQDSLCNEHEELFRSVGNSLIRFEFVEGVLSLGLLLFNRLAFAEDWDTARFQDILEPDEDEHTKHT